MKVSFHLSFIETLEKISRWETDRENNLILIKIAVQALLYIEESRKKSKEKKVGFNDKMEEESLSSTQLNEASSPNKLIKNILLRYVGDKLFVFISTSLIGEVLFENFDLYKILVFVLIKADKSVLDCYFYDKGLNSSLKKLLDTKFKSVINTSSTQSWNKGNLFKAYTNVFQFGLEYENKILNFDFNFDKNQNRLVLRNEDYEFINQCFTISLNPEYAENWKKGFSGFFKYVIQDIITIPEKCERSLKIIEKFLYLETIQKQVSEEIHDSLLQTIKDLVSCRNEVLYNITVDYIKKWSTNSVSSSLLRENLKKLLEIKFE